MLCGSDVSVWGAGRDRAWQWHIPRIILAQCCPCSLSASDPIRAGAVNASHRQGTQCTLCLLFNSHRTRVKRNSVCSLTSHWVVCTCPAFRQRSPPLYSGTDGHVKNRDFFFPFFFPKFINCEQRQVASANMKFLMLLINESDYAMELSIPKK